MGQRARAAAAGIGFLSLLLALSGCMYFREGGVWSPPNWPPRPSQEKKSVVVTVTRSVANESSHLEHHMHPHLQEVAVNVFKDSGLFSRVETSGDSTDLCVHIDATPEESMGLSMISTGLSAITLGFIPSYTHGDAMSVATITDCNQKVLGTVRKQERVSVVVQTFLIFVAPFQDTPSEFREKLYTDFFRATIDDAHAKGIL